MFFRCKSLKELEISNWDTSKVTDMTNMFSWCTSLKKLDLSGWDIFNVKDMDYMFNNCNDSIIPDWYKNK